MRHNQFVSIGQRAVRVLAGAVVLMSMTATAVGADQIDQRDASTGAVQEGSNVGLAGNGGESNLSNAPAEIAVGDVATGYNTGGANSNTITVTSTIEEQTSEASGGDFNVAKVSDDDPVIDDRDARIDEHTDSGFTVGPGGVFCDGSFPTANGGTSDGSANGGAVASDDGNDNATEASGGTGIADSSGGDPIVCTGAVG